MEKLSKLTLGLIALDCDRKWPTPAAMKAWDHKLVPVRQAIMEELRTGTASKSQYVRALLAEADTDPVVLPGIEALNMYGRMGPFYCLDQLGEGLQPVSRGDAWQKIESAALTDPDVAAVYQRNVDHVEDNEVWDLFIRTLNERITTSMERVWIMIAVCDRNYVLGDTNCVFGFDVPPNAVDRQ